MPAKKTIAASSLRAGMTLLHNGNRLVVDLVKFVPNDDPREVNVTADRGRIHLTFGAGEQVEVITSLTGFAF